MRKFDIVVFLHRLLLHEFGIPLISRGALTFTSARPTCQTARPRSLLARFTRSVRDLGILRGLHNSEELYSWGCPSPTVLRTEESRNSKCSSNQGNHNRRHHLGALNLA